ncbi:MAG: hypothetical protein AAGE59_00530 [Cyanobacteria bacterium P01_F01_bin.86]
MAVFLPQGDSSQDAIASTQKKCVERSPSRLANASMRVWRGRLLGPLQLRYSAEELCCGKFSRKT